MNDRPLGAGCVSLIGLGAIVLLSMEGGARWAALGLLALVGVILIAMRGSEPAKRDSQPGYQGPRPEVRGVSSSSTHRHDSPRTTITYHVDLSPASHRSSPRAQVDPDDVWVPPGSSMRVVGYDLPGGMIYVGRTLEAPGGWSEEPALIDPKLAVDRNHPDRQGEHLTYWPTYRGLPPASRSAYLEWLAEGRQDPAAPIGYVFLFYYGIERRLLVDRERSSRAPAESVVLLSEVERLASIYGSNASFARCSSSLLAFCRLRDGDASLELPEPFPEPPEYLVESRGSELPLELRYRLGQLLAAGRPLPAEWALAWFVASPGASLRTAARRCPEMFRRLFVHRYRESYGKGLTVRPNRTRLKVTYWPASPTLRGDHSVTLDLPDVGRLEAPLRKIGELADAVTDELDPYSRWLGRNPDQGGALPALALLPTPLLEEAESRDLDSFLMVLNKSLGQGDRTELGTDELLALWPSRKADRLSKKESASLSQLLEKLGMGIEPDVRFGGSPLKSAGRAVLFSLGDKAPSAASPDYSAASLLLHLATVVATADGEVSIAEERHLQEHLESALHLGPGERTRLDAHFAWLLADPPGFAGLKKRLEVFTQEQRHGIASFMVAVAGADGRIDAEEVKILARIYELLGLEPESLYSDLHGLAAGSGPATEPVTVREAGPSRPGFAVPAKPRTDPPDTGFGLDMERVAELRRVSEETGRLLAELFQEAEAEAGDRPFVVSGDDVAGVVEGLDTGHSALLRALAASETWSRSDFEALSDFFGLLPAGALETLNEAAFERCDAPLLEGEDPYAVDLDVVQEMLS